MASRSPASLTTNERLNMTNDTENTDASPLIQSTGYIDCGSRAILLGGVSNLRGSIGTVHKVCKSDPRFCLLRIKRGKYIKCRFDDLFPYNN